MCTTTNVHLPNMWNYAIRASNFSIKNTQKCSFSVYYVYSKAIYMVNILSKNVLKLDEN